MLGVYENIKLEALCATVSKERVSVADRCSHLMTEQKVKRLTKNTGICHLSIADECLCTSDFCQHSAEVLFSDFVNRNEIGALIFISQTADYLTPATSYYLQQRLNLPNDIMAFDVNLGCSGFVYGLCLAGSLLSVMGKRKVLLCVGDTSSRNAYPQDAGLFSIAGDAGAAVVIEKNKTKSRRMFFNIDSYGERADMLLVARGGYRAPRLTENGHISNIQENYCNMDGLGVMDFSLRDVPDNIERLLEYAECKKENVDIALLHQANKMIVSFLCDKLEISKEKAPFICSDIGNTSSASIPVCLSELKRLGQYSSYNVALMSGFGVGMSIASVITDISDMKVLETEEI